MVVWQCFFELPTAVNSVTVALFENSEPGGGAAVKKFWQTTFHRTDESTEADEEAEREGEKEEDERKSPPQRIEGLGDDAFWTADAQTNALYILKGDRFVRISVGGAGDIATKRAKASTLAEFVLKRL